MKSCQGRSLGFVLGLAFSISVLGWSPAQSASVQTLVLPESAAQDLAEILGHIRRAKRLVQIAVYRIEVPAVIEVIREVAKKGVRVKIITNDYDLQGTPYDYRGYEGTTKKLVGNRLTYEALKEESHVEFHFAPKQYFLYHPKFLVIDEKTAMVLTFNFNQSALVARNLGIIFEDSPELAQALSYLFELDFSSNGHSNIKKIASYLSHEKNLQKPRLVVAPHNYRDEIRLFLNNSHVKMDIYQTGLSDARICRAIRDSSITNQIPVRVLTSNDMFETPSKKQEKRDCISALKQAPLIEVLELTERPFYIHAKTFLAKSYDASGTPQHRVFLGSGNFLDEALSFSREAGVIFEDEKAFHVFSEYFEKDWQRALKLKKAS